jgi:hypothetical protein
MKLTRQELRQIIREVYKPGMKKKIQRAGVMDSDMLQNIQDLEASGIEGKRQAQDLALAMGSEEDESEFIDSATLKDIAEKNRPYKRNAAKLRTFMQFFVNMVTSLGKTGNSMGPSLFGRIPGVRGNPVNASPIKVGIADPQAFRDNLVGGDFAAAEVRLTIETVPDAEVVVQIEDNMFAYTVDVTIFLSHDQNFEPVTFTLRFTGAPMSIVDAVRQLDSSVRTLIHEEILSKMIKNKEN